MRVMNFLRSQRGDDSIVEGVTSYDALWSSTIVDLKHGLCSDRDALIVT